MKKDEAVYTMGYIKEVCYDIDDMVISFNLTNHKDELIVELGIFKTAISKLFLVMGYVRTEYQGV